MKSAALAYLFLLSFLIVSGSCAPLSSPVNEINAETQFDGNDPNLEKVEVSSIPNPDEVIPPGDKIEVSSIPNPDEVIPPVDQSDVKVEESIDISIGGHGGNHHHPQEGRSDWVYVGIGVGSLAAVCFVAACVFYVCGCKSLGEMCCMLACCFVLCDKNRSNC